MHADLLAFPARVPSLRTGNGQGIPAKAIEASRIDQTTWRHISAAKESGKPFLDTATHGIFATRSPKRPNPIGLSVVRLLSVEGKIVRFANPDMLDGTPLLDIKPYVSEFDRMEPEREGWFEGKSAAARSTRSDSRFSG
jgi:tRNA (Thr-GGU) A37 N-methylase